VAGDPERLFASGMAAVEAQDYALAEQCFRQIVALHPASHSAWNALAWTQLWSGQPEIGLEYARRAHELDRRQAEYLNTISVAQGELGEFAAAEITLRKALKLKPSYVEGLLNLGKVLHKEGRLPEAAKTYERAYALAPAFPKVALTLAQMYSKLGRAQSARALLAKADRTVEEEDFVMALAEVDSELEGPASALARLRASVAHHPEWRLATTSLGHLSLAIGEWREGWRYYLLRRHERDAASYSPTPLPARLDGKQILLRGEQGIGDVLFFLRFAPLLRARGARITLACEKKLAALIAAQDPLEAVREPLPDDGATTQFDFKLWIGDLPGLLGTGEVPAAWPFAVSDSDIAGAKARLAQLGPGPYLGITWRAGTDVLRQREFGNDQRVQMKEVSPSRLGAALRGWRGTLLALQRSPAAADMEAILGAAGAAVHDLSTLNEDLPAMLAMLAVVDDYVCVSNANVHLLAGLGRTARVLVPYPAEWRWMRSEGGSPWFPGFVLYREPQSRGWAEPLAQLRRDLIG
jgi:Flp pilus assembly protein TadD